MQPSRFPTSNMSHVAAKPTNPKEFHPLGPSSSFRAGTDMTNIGVENSKNAPVPIWMRRRIIFILMREDHEVGVSTCIQDVLVAGGVISCTINAKDFVRVYALPLYGHVRKILLRKLVFITIIWDTTTTTWTTSTTWTTTTLQATALSQTYTVEGLSMSSAIGSESSSSSDFQMTFLDLHNTERAAHGASNLTWSNGLAMTAQSWANNCIDTHSGGRFQLEGSPLGGVRSISMSMHT
jgi:hypothetical protein